MPNPNPDALSPARAALAAHIAEIATTRARIAELRLIHDRLREPERRARTDRICKDSLQREHEELMGAWLDAALDSPEEEVELPDISQFALDVEDERLRYIDRVVETTKPAMIKLAEQSTAAVQKLSALQIDLPSIVAKVHLEEAQAIAEDLLTLTAQDRLAVAHLKALRANLADRKQYKILETLPQADDLDLLPSHEQVWFERSHWDRYAAMLSENPVVTFEEAAI